ncbi:MAG: hypothetical protein HKN13_15335 [Rhodothermales bacterium]|nr:hypothetical protein [Rhodothermales bacterium]
MFGDRPFSHWPTVIATAFAFAILFELVYVVSMSLLGDPLEIGPDSILFGLAAFVGYLIVVAIIRRNPSSAESGHDQP